MSVSGPFTESVKVVELLQRPFGQLPMATDLPRLTNIRVVDENGRSGHSQPPPTATTLEKLEYTFVALTSLLFDEQAAEMVKATFREHFTEGIDVSKLQMESFLNKIGGDESPIVQILKAVNQSAISPAIIHLKLKLGLINMTKDVRDSWFYEIIVSSNTKQVVVASHKRDQCVKNNFQYEWVMAVHFDKFLKTPRSANQQTNDDQSVQQTDETEAKNLSSANQEFAKEFSYGANYDYFYRCTNVSLSVTDLMFSLALHTTNQTKRTEISNILEAYTTPDVLKGSLTRHWEHYPASSATENNSKGPDNETSNESETAKKTENQSPASTTGSTVKPQHGVKEYDNGDRYEGELLNGIREGEGCYKSATSGTIYQGGYKDGKRHGKGKISFPHGAVLEGNFQRGRVVHGVYTFSNGDKYVGDFKDDKFEGQGEWKGVVGDLYKGAWKAGLRHGKGTVKLARGDVYDGEFQNDLMHGFGKYHFSNGDLYMGQFANGMIHGMGEYKFASNPRVLLGEFAHGKLIKTSSTSASNGSGNNSPASTSQIPESIAATAEAS